MYWFSDTSTPIISILKILITCAILHCVIKFIVTPKLNKKQNINAVFITEFLVVIIWVVGIIAICRLYPSLSSLAESIIASSGIIAIVIGLAAQESFANIMAGIFISTFKPFNIGDRIHIAGDETAGFVKSINLRHTIISTYTGVDVIIPNSVMGSAKIENSSYSTGKSYPIEIDVAYESKEKRHRALEIMEEVVTNHPLFYDRRTESQIEAGEKPVTALCTSFASSGIHLKILMWTERFEDNAKACSECRMQILDRFEEEGIEVPYNKIVIANNV